MTADKLNALIDSATHVYVAVNSCGCWSAVTTDLSACGNEEMAKYTADDVADFIRSGQRVERVSLEEWKKKPFVSITKCPHKQNASKEPTA